MGTEMQMRIIVGITGASGALLGYRMLQELSLHDDVETHLVISKGAKENFGIETDLCIDEVYQWADHVHENTSLGACISSGSYKTDGMIVVPCSMKTLSGIANAFDSNLIVRAADVCLKEGRRVVLIPREMPLGRAHILNLLAAKDNGCTIMPPMLTFYNSSDTLEEQMTHVIGKILMQFGLESSGFRPWEGDDHQ